MVLLHPLRGEFLASLVLLVLLASFVVTKVWRVTSSSEVVEEPADGGTTEGSMGEQRELQESNNDHEGFKDYASLHLRYTNWQFHHLKENLQGKDVYNDTKTFQRYHGPKGLSPREARCVPGPDERFKTCDTV
ncbi:PREDICTED: uncharacterized protein LOC105586577 [Cercocebus atys]|uniref:uncharacterized protein LOC105586577 n=1 Tax=Cercocebus atys TaxID=9531 RepID=UPI0005F42509|nr:PREDICTED: uncharacterized protein LOC105586577 [Cercocebus atys]